MTEVTFRQGTEEDLPMIADMFERLDASSRELTYRFPAVDDIGQIWLESFRRTLGRFSVVFVAECDGGIVGFTLGRVKHTPPYLGSVLVGELSELWVEPEQRRLGIGEGLTRHAMEWLREHGVHSLEVQILEGNTASSKLYQGLGFEPELRQWRLVRNQART